MSNDEHDVFSNPEPTDGEAILARAAEIVDGSGVELLEGEPDLDAHDFSMMSIAFERLSENFAKSFVMIEEALKEGGKICIDEALPVERKEAALKDLAKEWFKGYLIAEKCCEDGRNLAKDLAKVLSMSDIVDNGIPDTTITTDGDTTND